MINKDDRYWRAKRRHQFAVDLITVAVCIVLAAITIYILLTP